MHAVHGVNHAAHGLKGQIERLDILHHALVWKVRVILLGSLLLLLGGGIWLLWQYKGEIERNYIQADLLRAYNHADVTLCDGRLCAKIDKRGKKYGEYQLVKLR